MGAERLRILLIDDDRVDRMAITRHVQAHGLPYEVQQAGSVAEGAARLRESSFDVVLLDYLLGDGSGLELLPQLNKTPAIILSGAGNEQVVVQAMHEGAYDYLIKDVECNYLTVLPATIHNVVTRKRAEEALRESEARYRTLFEVGQDAIFMVEDDRFLDCNPAALRMFGCSREQILEQTPYRFSPPQQPDGSDSREKARAMLAAALQRTPQFFEWLHVRYDGTPFDAEVSLNRVDLPGEVFVQGLVRDITARKRADQELKDYAAALESANRTLEELHAAAQVATRSKSEFLANMSHEIRTPLTAVIGFAEAILDGDESPLSPLRVEAVSTILRNGRHLLSIINDILDISKIEAGRLSAEWIRFSPVQLVADVLHLMRGRAAAKGLTLSLEYVGPIPVTVLSDPTRLRQVVINLIGNAVKFTETGSVWLTVRLVEEESEPMLRFDVTDTGIGMSPEEVSRLFQPFSQADNSTTRRFGGTGLGLTISKRLIEMLGGTIAVESRLGCGSTFRATVATGSLDGVSLLHHAGEDAVLPAASAGDHAVAQPKVSLDCRLLLVEDSLDSQRLISLVLKKAHAQVATAENGQIGCELALAAQDRGEPFDVILMDMQMPVLDGYEATRLLRSEGYSGKIVALTANAMAGQRDLCLAAGCDDYVTKPIERRNLFSLLAGLVARPAPAPAGVPDPAQ